MSADNWAICPKCEADRLVRIQKKQSALDKAYGQISLEKFDEKRAEIEALKGQKTEDTFREDYEIGVYNHVFKIDYSGSCSICRLSYVFKFEDDPLNPKEQSK